MSFSMTWNDTMALFYIGSVLFDPILITYVLLKHKKYVFKLLKIAKIVT